MNELHLHNFLHSVSAFNKLGSNRTFVMMSERETFKEDTKLYKTLIM